MFTRGYIPLAIDNAPCNADWPREAPAVACFALAAQGTLAPPRAAWALG